MIKDQKGTAIIDVYYNLMIIIFFLFMFLVVLSGVMQMDVTRSKTQHVANFIERQYRDEGCISYTTKEMAFKTATLSKMDTANLTVEGEDAVPLPYHSSKIITLTYKANIMVIPGVRVPRTFVIPIPIISQYSPSALTGGTVSCTSF